MFSIRRSSSRFDVTCCCRWTIASQRFSPLRRNQQIAEQLIAVQGHDAREKAIANVVCMDVNRGPSYGLGITAPGEEWRCLGRGLKQLPERRNYRNSTMGHEVSWGGSIYFEAEPDTVAEPVCPVRSALWCRTSCRSYINADAGMMRAVSQQITDLIDQGIGAESRTNRWPFSNSIFTEQELAGTCWNRSWVNSNSAARLPAAGGPG